jgi:molecular chaperone DnaK
LKRLEMSETVFGIDFGTTNSLAARVVGDRALSFVDQVSGRPHPSVVWYRGSDIVVGREARESMDLTDGGAPSGFLRSPKMALRRDGPVYVDGQPVAATDAIASVLTYLKEDAGVTRGRARGQEINRAVMTIPVDFGGPERRRLREAAGKAGISVVQFVHEPVAALYAFIRSQPDVEQEVAKLEGRTVLVFDWGGGTLDLTLCKIRGGSIMQIVNLGDNEIGGDRFDERLRNLVRSKHASSHKLEDVTALEQPGMAAKLLQQCENAKIALSKPDAESESIIVRNFLRTDGPSRNLLAEVTKEELERESTSFVLRGLSKIEEILALARLEAQDIELCLATGGMVNMPAIRNGLIEHFVGRVPHLPNGDRIIAEGAAWIAHDGLRLTLSKPLEILISDTSGRGSFVPLVEAGWPLPVENEAHNVTNTRLFCSDPREGVAVVEITKPVKIGQASQADERRTLCVTSVRVDPTTEPFMERIHCDLKIDHDYVASITLRSTGRGDETTSHFHDLDFGLEILRKDGTRSFMAGDEESIGEDSARTTTRSSGNLALRSNIVIEPADAADRGALWLLVPGDLASKWKPIMFDMRVQEATSRQYKEKDFYAPCNRCGRLISQIKAEGRVAACRASCGFGPG